MPKHIMFVITGLNGGGAERQVQSLAFALKERGHKTTVVAMLRPTNPTIADELTAANIPVHYLEMQRGKAQAGAIFKLAALVRELKPDVVHSHMVHANILARVTRVFCGKKMPFLVCTAHSTNEGGKLRSLLYRITDSLADITTQISKLGAEKYVREKLVSPKRMKYVPNGISTSKFSFSGEARARLREELGVEKNFVWITVARMEPPKDFFTLLDAFAEFCSENSALLIVGDGELRPQIEEKIAELQLEKRARILGFRKDVAELMRASDAFVLSSLWEGLPLVVCEAMSVGLPVVCGNVGGQVELIVDGETGFLFPPADVHALGIAYSTIEKMPPREREQISKNARERAETYDIERVVDVWEGVYNKRTTVWHAIV